MIRINIIWLIWLHSAYPDSGTQKQFSWTSWKIKLKCHWQGTVDENFRKKFQREHKKIALLLNFTQVRNFFQKKHTHTKGPLKLMTFLSQIIYLVYVKICETKSMI